MAQGYVRTADLPPVVPVFPLGGVLLLPRGQLPLNIFEPRYLNMVDDAMAGDRLIGMIQPVGGPPQHPALAGVGCAGRITGFSETTDGRYLITLTGICRFRAVEELPSGAPYRQMRAAFADYEADLAAVTGAEPDRAPLLAALGAYLEPRGLDIDWDAARAAPAEALVNSLSMGLPFEPAGKQALLEARDLPARAQALLALLRIDAADPGDGDPPPLQ